MSEIKSYIAVRMNSSVALVPSKSNATKIEFCESSGHTSSVISIPFLASSSGGRDSIEDSENSANKNGTPAPPNRRTIGMKTAHGLFMTVVAICFHTPSSLSIVNAYGTFPLFTLCPRIASTAGNVRIENNIAIETAKVPPIPREGSVVFLKNNKPIKPIATVRPLKKTALPAVAVVIAVAVLISRSLPISSLNLFTKKRE